MAQQIDAEERQMRAMAEAAARDILQSKDWHLRISAVSNTQIYHALHMLGLLFTGLFFVCEL